MVVPVSCQCSTACSDVGVAVRELERKPECSQGPDLSVEPSHVYLRRIEPGLHLASNRRTLYDVS